MATKKKAVAKKSSTGRAGAKVTASTGPYTTLRLIEKEAPCVEEYVRFLIDFGGKPVARIYKDLYNSLIGKNAPKERVGIDTPIPLATILKVKSSGEFNGVSRVDWLLCHECIQPLNFARSLHNLDDADGLAVRVLLCCDTATIARIVNG